jgi:hypothetical protein
MCCSGQRSTNLLNQIRTRQEIDTQEEWIREREQEECDIE